MQEECYSDSSSERQVTLMVVLKYHGEKIEYTSHLEENILDIIGEQLGRIVPGSADAHIMEASVDTVAHTQIRWNFEECPYCAARDTSECVTEYCAVRGPLNKGEL